MRFRRRLIATLTAALFVLSAVAQHAATAGMSAENGMATPAAASDMASHDGAPCPMSSDCAKDANMPALACFAHCATVVGVLSEPVQVLTSLDGHAVSWPLMPRLASLHGPPDPHPPKRSV